MLALIMSAMSPDRIGAVVWKEHPTLRALMKMITSGRYRFPTVDCDEKMREDMKQCEQEAREMVSAIGSGRRPLAYYLHIFAHSLGEIILSLVQETKIAEHLFLPPRRDNKNSKKMGSRVSRRLQKQQKEKEAAKELAGTYSISTRCALPLWPVLLFLTCSLFHVSQNSIEERKCFGLHKSQ